MESDNQSIDGGIVSRDGPTERESIAGNVLRLLENIKYVRSDQEWFAYYGKLYLFYVDSYKALEDSYDQLLHPQKRKVLKQLLENCMLRQIQVKQNLIYYSMEGNALRSDFVNLHSVCIREKRLLHSTEVQLPRYFVDDPSRRKAYRNQLLDKFLLEFHDNNAPEEEVLVERVALDSNINNAVWLIQKFERGRQGIERVLLAKYLKKLDFKKMEKHRKLQAGGEVAEETEREESILVIQKYYKGFKGRETVWNLRQKEELFLGFVREKPVQESEAYLQQQANRAIMKVKQQDYRKEYREAQIEAKDQLMDNWGEDIQNNMIEDRRKWYMGEVRKAEGKQVPTKIAQFYKKDEVRLPLTEEEQEAMDILDKEKKAAKKNKGKKKKKKKGEVEDIRVEQGPTDIVLKLQNQIERHNKDWRNEKDNFHQTHEQSLLRNEIAKDVEKQIRGAVDDMLDMELCNLKLALKAKKFKYPKKKKSKKNKKKVAGKKETPNDDDIYDEGEIIFGPRSAPKKKKKKFPGDKLTARKDPRDMLAELVEAGIVKKLQPARISDLIGEPNPMRPKMELLQDQVADPSIFDLRQCLVQFVGMPLGSTEVKDNIKESNYILFFGPNGSGKTHAVRALQAECDALLIDLSASNIENKYTDKPDQLLSLAFKVATCFQPAIIYVDEIEKIFKGKKKKKRGEVVTTGGGMNWVKMRKFLIKYGKYFTDKNRENVAIIGCTNAPWSANKKQLKTFFKRRVYFPSADYATRIMLFKKYFQAKNAQLHPNFPISTLAHITEGFTAGNIKEALSKVLTERRMLLSNEMPFRVSEFIDSLSAQQSTYLQRYMDFRKFHDEMSGNKARIDKIRKPPDDEKGKKKPSKKGKK